MNFTWHLNVSTHTLTGHVDRELGLYRQELVIVDSHAVERVMTIDWSGKGKMAIRLTTALYSVPGLAEGREPTLKAWDARDAMVLDCGSTSNVSFF